MKTLKKGQKISYIKVYNFGKKAEITAKIVAIVGNKVLLDNGDEFHKMELV